jgi:hypothetical protein
MFGMNFFSIIVTFAVLIATHEFMPTVRFLLGEPAAFYDITILSLCASLGQVRACGTGAIHNTLRSFCV